MDGRTAVARLGRELMDAVGRVMPVVPVALIAHIFLEHRSLTELDLKAETRRLVQRLEKAHVYTVKEEELPLLRYYANSIAHLLPA
jgi:glycerol-3-phosphate O-acyltransferase